MKKRIITGWMLSLSIVSGFAADRVGSAKDEAKSEEVWDVIRQLTKHECSALGIPSRIRAYGVTAMPVVTMRIQKDRRRIGYKKYEY